jgi:hypothetical protein
LKKKNENCFCIETDRTREDLAHLKLTSGKYSTSCSEAKPQSQQAREYFDYLVQENMEMKSDKGKQENCLNYLCQQLN